MTPSSPAVAVVRVIIGSPRSLCVLGASRVPLALAPALSKGGGGGGGGRNHSPLFSDLLAPGGRSARTARVRRVDRAHDHAVGCKLHNVVDCEGRRQAAPPEIGSTAKRQTAANDMSTISTGIPNRIPAWVPDQPL